MSISKPFKLEYELSKVPEFEVYKSGLIVSPYIVYPFVDIGMVDFHVKFRNADTSLEQMLSYETVEKGLFFPQKVQKMYPLYKIIRKTGRKICTAGIPIIGPPEELNKISCMDVYFGLKNDNPFEPDNDVFVATFPLKIELTEEFPFGFLAFICNFPLRKNFEISWYHFSENSWFSGMSYFMRDGEFNKMLYSSPGINLFKDLGKDFNNSPEVENIFLKESNWIIPGYRACLSDSEIIVKGSELFDYKY